MLETLYTILMVQTTLAVVLFVVSLLVKRNDIADIAWGPGIALVAFTAAVATSTTIAWPHYLMLALIALWATRIGVRIGKKNLNKPEDVRYAQWRESWGRWFYLRSFFQVYLLQCGLMIFLAMSAVVAVHAPVSSFLAPLIISGTLLWLIGFVFETVGDYQLDRFLGNPANKGKLMRYGLWHYSRHPNYFGEVTMWWGLWLMTATLPLTWLAALSPITITILILFVSGIPMLEYRMQKHPEWSDYARTTSVLVPWWPRS